MKLLSKWRESYTMPLMLGLRPFGSSLEIASRLPGGKHICSEVAKTSSTIVLDGPWDIVGPLPADHRMEHIITLRLLFKVFCFDTVERPHGSDGV